MRIGGGVPKEFRILAIGAGDAIGFRMNGYCKREYEQKGLGSGEKKLRGAAPRRINS